MIRNYKKIAAWQHGHAVALAIYKCSRRFPEEERYGLTRQLRRAAASVPANIAEGSSRNSNKEYLRFLFVSLTSLKETEYYLLLAKDLGYLDRMDYEYVTKQINSTLMVLHGLINSLKRDVRFVGPTVAMLFLALQVFCHQYVWAAT